MKTALEVAVGQSEPVVVVDGAETSTVLLSLLMDGASLQNSAEAPSRPSHLQRSSTSGLLLVSMAVLLVRPSSYRLNLSWLREDTGLVDLCDIRHFKLFLG